MLRKLTGGLGVGTWLLDQNKEGGGDLELGVEKTFKSILYQTMVERLDG